MNEITSELVDAYELGKSKGLKITGADGLIRLSSIVADGLLKKRITSHADYQDGEGNIGTSKKGFVLQINKRIKKEFGCPVNEMTPFHLEYLTMIRGLIVSLIAKSEKKHLSRKVIKRKVYGLISEMAKNYHQVEEYTGEDA